jgi:hypothetical protein
MAAPLSEAGGVNCAASRPVSNKEIGKLPDDYQKKRVLHAYHVRDPGLRNGYPVILEAPLQCNRS